jgi:CubicO group peptidase (beta-lactamase class C family)
MMRRDAPRRAAAFAVAIGALLSIAASAQAQVARFGTAGPRFRADGPEADAYGRSEGYPRCSGVAYVRELRCRVGAFSHFDNLFPARTIRAPQSPAPLGRAASEPDIRYTYLGQSRTLDDYLAANHVTGLLVAQGSTILAERYQYGRTDKHRLTSFSMAKTIIGLLIGIAVQEGTIRSVNDLAEIYVPGLQGTEFGRTSIKVLLQMASGVAFREVYTDVNSDAFTLARLTLAQDPGGSLAAVKRFNTRDARRRESGFPIRRPSPWCSALCSPARRAERCRTLRVRSCGDRSGRKRMRAGSSTPQARKSRSLMSTRFCATGRGLA